MNCRAAKIIGGQAGNVGQSLSLNDLELKSGRKANGQSF